MGSLAADGPPTCPACGRTVTPMWAFCASCGAELDGDADPVVGLEGADDAALLVEIDDTEPEFDHRNPDDLRRAYEQFDTIAEAAEQFDVAYHTVRKALIDHGIHTPDSYA